VVSGARDFGTIPSTIPNQIGGRAVAASDGRTFVQRDPATGDAMCDVARSGAADVRLAPWHLELASWTRRQPQVA